MVTMTTPTGMVPIDASEGEENTTIKNIMSRRTR
jgi:hypothetical protein